MGSEVDSFGRIIRKHLSGEQVLLPFASSFLGARFGKDGSHVVEAFHPILDRYLARHTRVVVTHDLFFFVHTRGFEHSAKFFVRNRVETLKQLGTPGIADAWIVDASRI